MCFKKGTFVKSEDGFKKIKDIKEGDMVFAYEEITGKNDYVDCKVDRSASYYARYVAKTIVEAELAESCEVCIACLIRVAEAVSVYVNTFNTDLMNDNALLKLIKEHFDFTPTNIKKELELDKVKFKDLSCYGDIGGKVNHIKRLNVENVGDESVSINPENLELLCKDCHNKERKRFSRNFKFDDNGKFLNEI